MANVYQFSQSSLKLLERCIEAASQPEAKWIELFKNDTKNVAKEQEYISFKHEAAIPSQSDVEVKKDSEEYIVSKQSDEVDKIYAILEAAPSNKLNYLTRECNEHLMPVLVEKLTLQCIEIICKDVLNNLDTQYERIFQYFFPGYINKATSCVALNLLISSYNTYPLPVINLIVSMFGNINIHSKIFEEFFIAANNERLCIKFLQDISINELPTDVFVHHLNTINYLYKSSDKTLELQNFLLNELLKSSDVCQDDKNYGRILLTFFQSVNESNVQMNLQSLQKLLDCHKTSFKRPCQTILCNLYNKPN